MEFLKVPYLDHYSFQFLSMTCQMQTPILKVFDLQTTILSLHIIKQRSAKNFEYSCRVNGMELNANKCKLLNVDNKLTTSICGQVIKLTESQKDHGLIITSIPSWQGNCIHRVQKVISVFFQIKRNMLAISSASNKMNCYTGYIVQIL